jgi:hypothetical protein
MINLSFFAGSFATLRGPVFRVKFAYHTSSKDKTIGKPDMKTLLTWDVKPSLSKTVLIICDSILSDSNENWDEISTACHFCRFIGCSGVFEFDNHTL